MSAPAEGEWPLATCPTFWIQTASRFLTRHFEAHLRPLGFGSAYLPVAVALEKNGPMRQKDLAELASVEQATMATLLARMESDGLIARTPHPTDRRASLVALTKEAKTKLPAAKKAHDNVVHSALGGVSERHRDLIIALMTDVMANLEDL